MRPDAYLIVSAGQRLHAPTLEELAEIAECAVAAGDRIELPRTATAQSWRLLSDDEFGRFLRLLASPARLTRRHRQSTRLASPGPKREEDGCPT